MNPIRSFEEVLAFWDIFEEGNYAFYSFLLYTNQDNNISKYVRENYNDLDMLTGQECMIFLVEKPPKNFEEKLNNRNYWSERKKGYWWSGFEETIPYERENAYEIARILNIQPNEIPCLVLFKHINDKKCLVYPLDNSWSDNRFTAELRDIFTIIQGVSKGDNLEKQRKKVWNKLKGRMFIEKTMGIMTHPLVKNLGTAIKEIAGIAKQFV